MPTPPCKKKEVQTSEYPKVTQLLDKRGAVIGVVVQCAPHADDWTKYRPSPDELSQQWVEHWREARGR